MFKDSKIAQSFTCGSAKCLYIINFGLVLYFKDILNQTLSEAPYCVTCFDESHNDILKKGQMDLNVRFWDSTKNIVQTRY